MVQDLFDTTTQKSLVIFCGEVDAFGGRLFEDTTAQSEVRWPMDELISQLDIFDKGGNIKA